MARLQTRYNLALVGEDKFAEDVTTKDSNTPTLSLAISCPQTPASAQVPIFAPSLPGMYTNINLQKATRLALELFIKGQEYGQFQANSPSFNCLFKARNPKLYYDSTPIEYYYFCWQCKDHFDMVGTTNYQRVSFMVLFFSNRINFRWQQHKT